MSGGHVLYPKCFLNHIPHEGKFQKRIAVNTRIRRLTNRIRFAKTLDDQFLKRLGHIHKIMRDTHLMTHKRRIHPAAAPAERITRNRNLHRDAHHIPAGLAEQMSRNTAVHTPAHQHRHLPIYSFRRRPRFKTRLHQFNIAPAIAHNRHIIYTFKMLKPSPHTYSPRMQVV